MAMEETEVFYAELKDHIVDPWGMYVSFHKPGWPVRVVPNQQVARLGVITNDRIVAWNGIELNAQTSSALKEELCKGSACEICFSRKPQQVITRKKEITMLPGPVGINFSGNKIVNVLRNSQAMKYGISIGWRIAEVDGEQVLDDQKRVDWALKKARASGRKYPILFQVCTKEIIIQPGIIGINYVGNKIINVRPDSQAMRSGICIGWKILEVDGEVQYNDQDDINRSLRKAKDKTRGFMILFDVSDDTNAATPRPDTERPLEEKTTRSNIIPSAVEKKNC